MKERSTAKQNKKKLTERLIALLLCVLMLVITAGCSAKSDAQKKVARELDALKTSESVGSEVDTLRRALSDEGKASFDAFLKNLRNFDYEITGESVAEDHMTVTVRIRTCDFGREYLATWTGYLREHGDTIGSDDELTGFYEELFARLAALEKKDCIKDVEIVCIEPLGNGEWIANIKDNDQLQDAIFGGMLSEMRTLAGE